MERCRRRYILLEWTGAWFMGLTTSLGEGLRDWGTCRTESKKQGRGVQFHADGESEGGAGVERGMVPGASGCREER